MPNPGLQGQLPFRLSLSFFYFVPICSYEYLRSLRPGWALFARGRKALGPLLRLRLDLVPETVTLCLAVVLQGNPGPCKLILRKPFLIIDLNLALVQIQIFQIIDFNLTCMLLTILLTVVSIIYSNEYVKYVCLTFNDCKNSKNTQFKRKLLLGVYGYLIGTVSQDF